MDNKYILKLALPSIIFLVIYYILYTFLAKKSIFSMVFLLLFMLMFKDFWQILLKNAKNYTKILTTVLILLLIIKFLGLYGIIGFILIILLIAGYRIYKSWQIFTGAMQTIETMIWGKPLKKGFNKENEQDTTTKEEPNSEQTGLGLEGSSKRKTKRSKKTDNS